MNLSKKSKKYRTRYWEKHSLILFNNKDFSSLEYTSDCTALMKSKISTPNFSESHPNMLSIIIPTTLSLLNNKGAFLIRPSFVNRLKESHSRGLMLETLKTLLSLFRSKTKILDLNKNTNA